MKKEDSTAIVDKHIEQLREFFPHVQILVTWPAEEGGTEDLFRGSGNWYARVGMAREFLTRDEGQTTAREIKDALNRDEGYI